MALEESIDKLTASIDTLIAKMEAGGAPAAAGKAAGGKAASKAKPKFTADQIKAKFQELRANEKVGAPPLKDLISGLGHADLAALLVSPDSFDAAMEGLLKIESEIPADDGDDL